MKRAMIFAGLSGVGLAALTTPAMAQDQSGPDANAAAAQPVADPSPPPADDETIIVTAQKYRQRAIDVPQSISVVTGQRLEAEHATQLLDYLVKIPSANVVSNQPGQARIILRGINTGGVGATVATYIDETPYGSATSLANGAILAPDLNPYDLARVEVLRGPQGTLYGANSLGGLVKYVTVAPSTSGVFAAGEIGVESVSHGDTSPWARAIVNVPLGTSAAVRVSGNFRDIAGYIDDPNLGNDVNDGKQYGGRVSFLAQPSEALTLRASALVQNIRSHGTNTVDVDPITLKPVLGKYEHLRVIQEPNDIDYRLYNATIGYDFGPVELVSATSYGRLTQDQVQDASGLYGPLLSLIFDIPLGSGLDQNMKLRRWTQEVRLSSTKPGFFRWTVGGFYTREKNLLAQNLFAMDYDTGDRIAALDGLIVVALPSRYRELAGFANATLNFSDRFDLTFGGRYSNNKQSVVQDTDGPLAGGFQRFQSKSSDNVFTYSVAPSFKPRDDLRIYARVAKGYRPGGPNAVSPLAPDEVPREFGPDTTVNYELGIKGDLADRRLAFELTGFIIDWKDVQLLAQVGDYGVNTNGGRARSSGVEFNVEGRPMPGLSLYANGSFVHARLTEDTPALVGGLKGDRLPFNPKFQATVGAEYSHQLAAATKLNTGISLTHIGNRKSDFNTDFGQRTLKAYDRLDAHVGVDFGRFRVDAFARNLTNSRGYTSLGPAGSAQFGAVTAGITTPRTIGISLGARY